MVNQEVHLIVGITMRCFNGQRHPPLLVPLGTETIMKRASVSGLLWLEIDNGGV